VDLYSSRDTPDVGNQINDLVKLALRFPYNMTVEASCHALAWVVSQFEFNFRVAPI
jgi:hypothetical protein